MDNERTFDAIAGAPTDTIISGGSANEPGGCDAAERITALLDQLEEVVTEEASRSHTGEALGLLERAQRRVASMMCMLTRTVVSVDPGTDPTEVLRQKTRLSTRDAKRIAKVAERLSEMPKVAEKFAEGDITLDHAAALANAADKVGPEAVEADPTLLEVATDTRPDTFSRRARDWSNQKLIEAGVDILERQRRAREAKLWVDKDTGLGMLFAKLPALQFAHLRQAIDGRYLQLLRQDSTNGQDPDEVRTPKQRLADVVYELLTNRHPVTGELLPTKARVAVRASTQLIVTAPVDVVDGTNPGGHCEIIGVGPVPRQILNTLTSDTELAGMIFDRTGRPLWLGRKQRLANAPQRLAVAIRDGGCFECGAPMHRCELHHIQEWHRDGGRTDVNNLVAVCRRHHKWLETNNLIVRPTPDGGYQAQPRYQPPP